MRPGLERQLSNLTSIDVHAIKLRVSHLKEESKRRLAEGDRAGARDKRNQAKALAKALNTPLTGKVLTVLVHLGIVVSHIQLLECAKGWPGVLAVNLVAIHFALLLNIGGPKPASWWWVPSPHREPLSVLLLLVIGVVHFVSVGTTVFYWLEQRDCSEALGTVFYAYHDDVESLEGMTVTQMIDDQMRLGGCSNAASRTKECRQLARTLEEFADGLDGDAALGEAIDARMGAEGCEAADVLGEMSLLRRLTFIDRLWFVFVLLSSVGYGHDIVPTSPISRQFTLTWSLYGLFIFGILTCALAEAGAFLLKKGTQTSVARKMHEQNLKRKHRLKQMRKRSAASPDGVDRREFEVGARVQHILRGAGVVTEHMEDGRTRVHFDSGEEHRYKPSSMHKLGPETYTPPAIYYVGRGLYFEFVAFLMLNFGGALIFMQLEEGWKFADGIYHCMMTCTTIGLGEIAPESQAGRAYGIVHLLLSVVLFGGVLGTILDGFARRVHATKKEEMLHKTLDEKLIVALDRDGDGVDRAEFVLGMLQLLGVVTEEDYAPFLEQFDELDATGDGHLTHDDLVGLAESNMRRKEGEEKAQRERRAIFSAEIRQYAHDLLPHTFISCFGFLLMQEFGFLLTAGGLAHGLAIGAILGLPPSERKYRRVVMATALGGLTFLAAVGLIVFYLSDTRLYIEVMGKGNAVVLGYLDERAVTVMYAEDHFEAMIDAWVSTVREPCNMIIVLVYAASLCNTVKLDVQTILACRDARNELRREKEQRAAEARKQRASASRADRAEKRLSGEAESSAAGEAESSASGVVLSCHRC